MPLDLEVVKAARVRMTTGHWSLHDNARVWGDGGRTFVGSLNTREDDRDGIITIMNAADEMIAEIERLRAELNRVAPYLAVHGACGYEFIDSTETESNE